MTSISPLYTSSKLLHIKLLQIYFDTNKNSIIFLGRIKKQSVENFCHGHRDMKEREIFLERRDKNFLSSLYQIQNKYEKNFFLQK